MSEAPDKHPLEPWDRPVPPPGPELEHAEDGWTPRVRRSYQSPGRSFVSGEPDGERLRVRYYTLGDNSIIGRCWFGPDAEGPPGHAHGGSMAALLDEAMGGAAWASGRTVVAGEITVRFKAMLPLGTVATFQAAITEQRGRRVQVEGRLWGPDGTVHATSKGAFIEIDTTRFGDLGRVALDSRAARTSE